MTPLNKLLVVISFWGMWPALLTSEVPSDRDRVIAESDGGKLLYRMIACEPRASTAGDRHASEQKRLARSFHEEWINAAAKMYGVALTPEEEAVVARQTTSEEPHIEAAAVHFHAVDVAALRIRRGDDRARVLTELSKEGVTAQELDWEFEQVPTIAGAERLAARDCVAELRQAARDNHSLPYILEHLREIVRKRAAAEHVSFDAVEEQFWSEVARATHTRIVDPAFSLPDRKGILVSR
jgi:hypothetical protein